MTEPRAGWTIGADRDYILYLREQIARLKALVVGGEVGAYLLRLPTGDCREDSNNQCDDDCLYSCSYKTSYPLALEQIDTLKEERDKYAELATHYEELVCDGLAATTENKRLKEGIEQARRFIVIPSVYQMLSELLAPAQSAIGKEE